ncbi:MAG TPA: hypothetical protein VMD28_10295, partial [Acidimicrobiales bacterium]|nr:hypothetical protein [Acidimicrobiales bacterium]
MAEPTLDVKASFGLVRRLWPWVAATCLIGAVAGANYEWFFVRPYHASSLVLLPASVGPSAGTSAHPAITTDARIVDSGAVLTPAARQAGATLSLQQLQASVSASPTSGGVLKITAVGTSASQVTKLVNAVADQLVVFMTTSGSAANSNAVVALQSEIKQVDDQITDVQG